MAGGKGEKVTKAPSAGGGGGGAPATRANSKGPARRVAMARNTERIIRFSRMPLRLVGNADMLNGMADNIAAGNAHPLLTTMALAAIEQNSRTHPILEVREASLRALDAIYAGHRPESVSSSRALDDLWVFYQNADDCLAELGEATLRDGDYLDQYGLLHHLAAAAGLRLWESKDKSDNAAAFKIKVPGLLVDAVSDAKKRMTDATAETRADFEKKNALIDQVACRDATVLAGILEGVLTKEGTVEDVNPFSTRDLLFGLYNGANAGYYKQAIRTLLINLFAGREAHLLHCVEVGLASGDPMHIRRAMQVMDLMAPVLTPRHSTEVERVRDRLIGILVSAQNARIAYWEQKAEDQECGIEPGTAEQQRRIRELARANSLLRGDSATFYGAEGTLLRMECHDYPHPYPLFAREDVEAHIRQLRDGAQPIPEAMVDLEGRRITREQIIRAYGGYSEEVEERGEKKAAVKVAGLGNELRAMLDRKPPVEAPAVLPQSAYCYQEFVRLMGKSSPFMDGKLRIFGQVREYQLPVMEKDNADARGRIRRELMQESIANNPYLAQIIKDTEEDVVVIGVAFVGNAFGDLQVEATHTRLYDKEVVVIYGNADTFEQGMEQARGKKWIGAGQKMKVMLITNVGTGTRSEVVCLAEDNDKGGIYLLRTPARDVSLMGSSVGLSQFKDDGAGMIYLLSSDNLLLWFEAARLANGMPVKQAAFGFWLAPQRRLIEGIPDGQLVELKGLGQMAIAPDGTVYAFVEKPPQLSILRYVLRRTTLELHTVKVGTKDEPLWVDHRQAFREFCLKQPGGTSSLCHSLGISEIDEMFYSAVSSENWQQFRDRRFVVRRGTGGRPDELRTVTIPAGAAQRQAATRQVAEIAIQAYYDLAQRYFREQYLGKYAEGAVRTAEEARWRAAFSRVTLGASSEAGEEAKPGAPKDAEKSVFVDFGAAQAGTKGRWRRVNLDRVEDLDDDRVAREEDFSSMSLAQLQLMDELQREVLAADDDIRPLGMLGRMPIEGLFGSFCRDKYGLAIEASGAALDALVFERDSDTRKNKERKAGAFRSRGIDPHNVAEKTKTRLAQLNLTLELGAIEIPPLPPGGMGSLNAPAKKEFESRCDAARKILEKYFGERATQTEDEGGFTDEEVASMARIARFLIHTYVNSFNMAIHESLAPIFAKYADNSPLARHLSQTIAGFQQRVPLKGATGEFDWATRVVDAMFKTQEEFLRDIKKKKPKVRIWVEAKQETLEFEPTDEDLITVWKVGQELKEASKKMAQEAHMPLGPYSSGIGAMVADEFSDVGTIAEQTRTLFNVFHENAVMRCLYRFLFGIRPERNFEVGVRLGNVTLTNAQIEAIHDHEHYGEGEHKELLFTKKKVDGKWQVEIGTVTILDVDRVYLGGHTVVPAHTTISEETILLDTTIGKRKGEVKRPLVIPKYVIAQGSFLSSVRFIRQRKNPNSRQDAIYFYFVDWRGQHPLMAPPDTCMASVEMFNGRMAIGVVPISVPPNADKKAAGADMDGKDPTLGFYPLDKSREKGFVFGVHLLAPYFTEYVAMKRRRTHEITQEDELHVSRAGVSSHPETFIKEHTDAAAQITIRMRAAAGG